MIVNTVINLIPFNRIILTIVQEDILPSVASPENKYLPPQKDIVIIKDVPYVIQPQSLSNDFLQS